MTSLIRYGLRSGHRWRAARWAPWAVAMADLVYPQTRGERPPDFEKKLQYTHALMRLTAEDAEADKILAEVRSLVKPASALHEPELARRVMAMMAPA